MIAMRGQTHRLLAVGGMAVLTLLGGVLAAQQPRPNPPARADQKAEGKTPKADASKKAGGLRLPAAEPPNEEPNDLADPLRDAPQAADANAPRPAVPEWPYHFEFRLQAYDGQFLAARYYPSQQADRAPVVLLVHGIGAGRSGKDFEDPITELKNKSLATHLQEKGYAVLVVDLRGHGANPRKTLSPEQWRGLSFDLQAAYHFLLDRHNRRELNLAKFGVIGLGEGANLASFWASRPGAAVSVDGRLSDLAALALVSPLADDRGIRLVSTTSALAPRFPILMIAAEGDAPSADAIKEVQETIERQRQGRIALVEGRQNGYNLLRFTPGATDPILRFLETTLEARNDEWEPRFNLQPVTFMNVQLVNPNDTRTAPEPAGNAAPKALEKGQER